MTPAALGAPVAALVQRCGVPAAVTSDRSGNRFIFSENNGALVSEAIVGADAAAVHAIALSGTSGSVVVSIGDRPRTLTLGERTLAQNDDELSADARNTFANVRVYGLSEGAQRLAVLTFDRSTQRLAAIAVGDAATLARMGQIPGTLDGLALSELLDPPVFKRGAAFASTGTRATIVRIDVDRDGIVRQVAIVVPSGDAAFDAGLPAKLDDDRYAPATVGGRAIGGSVYREIRH